MLKLVRAGREGIKLTQDLQSYGADAVTHHNVHRPTTPHFKFIYTA